MTDQIPADKVREVRDLHRDAAKMVTITDVEREIHQHVADAMEALLPAPPTLADMTPVERIDCKWMQAEVGDEGTLAVLVIPWWKDGIARVMWPGGFTEEIGWGEITPRPDLPRMEWPGDQKPAHALPDGWQFADHPDHGRVIVTRPEPDDDGEVCSVAPSVGFLGYGCCFCKPDELTYIDTEKIDTPAPVPLNTLAVGSVIESADDPRIDALPDGSVLVDCDGETVAKRSGEWRGIGYVPIPSERDEFGPWTVRRIGWGADQ